MKYSAVLKLMVFVGLTAITLATTACNTVAGAGKDTQAAGQAVTNAADKAK